MKKEHSEDEDYDPAEYKRRDSSADDSEGSEGDRPWSSDDFSEDEADSHLLKQFYKQK